MPVIVTIRSRLLEMVYDFIDNLLVCKQEIELEGANGHLALCAEVAVDVVDVLKIHVHLIVMPLQSLVKLLGLLPLHFFLRAIGLWHQLRIQPPYFFQRVTPHAFSGKPHILSEH